MLARSTRIVCVRRSFQNARYTTGASDSAPLDASGSKTTSAVQSSCPKDTVMPGLTWLKGQAPVVALADEEYPAWLWTILEPKKYSEEEMQPGGKGFQVKLRNERRAKIRLSNFMKTQ